MDMSFETARQIIKSLGYRKVFCKWVPHLLSGRQKEARVHAANKILGELRKKGDRFLKSVVTVDETWVRHYDPLTRRESRQWKKSTEKTPLKPKIGPVVGKVMCTVFFDSEGIVCTDFLPKGETINSAQYVSSLKRMLRAITKKRPDKRRHNFALHQDNARPHVSRMTTDFLRDQKISIIEHPPYSPDLAPADFFLFPRLKKIMRGTCYRDDEQVRRAVCRVLAQISEDGLLAAFQEWVKRLERCVMLGGDYVE